jgi:branched-chain amino acid transport system substrate-binding protein
MACRFRGLLALTCVLLLASCGTSQPSLGALDTTAVFSQDTLSELPQSQTYRIGINTEVTGSGAQIGDMSIRAARLAVEEINAAGGVNGVPLELVVRDCRSDVVTALEQYRQAIATDRLVALLGPVKSAYAVPMVREHLQHSIPLFIGATNTTLTEQGDSNLFQMRPSIRVTAAAMVAFAVEHLSASRVGIIYDTDLHGSNGAARVKAELKLRDRFPVVEAYYETATNDYDGLAQQVAAAKVDTVFIYGTNPTDIGRLLRDLRYRNRDLTIVTSPGGASAVTYNLAGDAQDGIYVAIDSLLESTTAGAHFEQAFFQRFGLAPDTYVAWYYDAVYLLAATLRHSPGNISEAIRRTPFEGAQGVYRFDANGEGLHTAALVRMLAGDIEMVGSYGEAGFAESISPSHAPGKARQ